MRLHSLQICVFLLGLATTSTTVLGDEPTIAKRPSASARKKVLVELFTSQGCDSCPAAEQVFGSLERLGVTRDRVVPLAFHVDYFNTPWKDPYSDPTFSRRQSQYSLIWKREKGIDAADYLYFTPMLMVDGRVPMLGSNASEAKRALALAVSEKPGALISSKLGGSAADSRRTLKVEVEANSPEIVGRDLIVGVALTENPISTAVASGENGGKSLVEHFATRSFVVRSTKLARGESKSFEVPISLPRTSAPERFAVAVFVQDVENGRIYQAESLPWIEEPKKLK